MFENQDAFRILSSIAFETVKSESQKSMILGQISNFSNFWKFRIRFWYQLKQMFLINYQYFRSYATFLLKL